MTIFPVPSARLGLVVLFVVIAIATSAWCQDDPARLLGRKDVAERLAAVEQIRVEGHADAEKLLRDAVTDRDWEVQHRAVEALGALGRTGATKLLVQVATAHDARPIRIAAARALKASDPVEATKQLTAKLKGSARLYAAQALAEIADASGQKTLEKLINAKETELRPIGLIGLGRVGAGGVETFVESLNRSDSVVAAAAVAALVERGGLADLSVLLERHATERLTDVMERRIRRGIVTIAGRLPDLDRSTAVDRVAAALASTRSAVVAERTARLLGDLGRDGAVASDAAAKALLAHALVHDGGNVRAAAASALARMKADAFDAVVNVARADVDERVRFHALRAVVVLDERRSAEVLTSALASDAAATIREEAAAICGRLHLAGTEAGLRAALKDPHWTVALAAAVSLGSLQDAAAIDPLKALYASSDWKVRGAAITGLGRIGRAEVVDFLIDAMDDPDPTVANTVLDFVKRLTRSNIDGGKKRWQKWWEANKSKFAFEDRNRRYDDAKNNRYAFGDFKQRPYTGFQDIGVIVLGGGKDSLQVLLTKLGITHEMTLPGRVKESSMQPNAVFFANCPGQIQDDDVERLDWFVRSGGFLFATCWALTRTVATVFPGVIHADRGESDPGAVEASPVDRESIHLHNVFGDMTDPLYQMAGYQLITIDDRERFEVLVDSVEADARWGEGNLAGWFSVGHGVVVDTTNHLVLQGMNGRKFKTDDERKAFALERLGYDYADLRELEAEGAFKKDSTAANACDDQSMMRLLARFVHNRRQFDG